MIKRILSLLVLALLLATSARAQVSRIFHYGPEAHTVTQSLSLVCVGFREPMGDGRAASFLQLHGDLLVRVELRLPAHGVALYEVGAGLDPLEVARTLRPDPGLAFAHPVYHLGPAEEPRLRYMLTSDLCVGVRGGVDVRDAAASVGASVVRSFAWPGTYLLRLPPESRTDPLEASEILLASGQVEFAHPDWLRWIGLRETIPNDPQFPSQWHLKNTGQGGGTPGADVKATFAWDITTGDPNVIVCVIDTGVERSHVDISQTPDGFNALCGSGPLMGDPRPVGCSNSYAGSHGTSCAGVAAADWNNATGVAGVAGTCVVMPINLLGSGMGYGTPSMEAACFDWATSNGAALITNSWGPDGVPWPLPPLVEASFINSTTNGRGGLGCCIFWAAGNGNELISTDEYASSQYTMAVGASTNFDVRASYSDFGPELDFVCPSSGGSLGITTTSTNSSGSSSYTGNFGGTSSASPLGAGIAALALTVNPSLTWTQVRDILRGTAIQIDPSSSPSAPNYYNPATGHSSWYGWGRLDAYQVVLAAQGTSGGFNYTLTTTGAGDADLQVVNAPANAELYIPFVPNPTNPQGSGPIFGLAPEAIFTLVFPLGTDPFHVLADANGAYSLVLGPGTVPSGLVTDSICLVFDPSIGVTQSSLLRRVAF